VIVNLTHTNFGKVLKNTGDVSGMRKLSTYM